MKVTSTETIHFPSLNWGITAGEERELPEGKEAQAVVLAHPSITEVGTKSKTQERVGAALKADAEKGKK